MIKAKFEVNEAQRKLTLKVKGHAGYGDMGHDLICSAASILCYTLAQKLKTEHDYGFTKYQPTLHLKAGNTNISVRVKDDDSFNRIMENFCFAQTGFQLLAHNHPEHVDVTLFGEDNHSGIE